MYSSLAIAYAFVQKGIETRKPVTQMKLQKLVYFAHGFHLAKYDKPLVNDNFLAWEYGPVVPEIYQYYKIYGSSPIIDVTLLPPYYEQLFKTSLNSEARDIINLTWEALKDIDAITLSAWTHKPNSPWGNHYKNGTIPDSEIQEYFKKEFLSPKTTE